MHVFHYLNYQSLGKYYTREYNISSGHHQYRSMKVESKAQMIKSQTYP